jgi:hypothetical protein
MSTTRKGGRWDLQVLRQGQRFRDVAQDRRGQLTSGLRFRFRLSYLRTVCRVHPIFRVPRRKTADGGSEVISSPDFLAQTPFLRSPSQAMESEGPLQVAPNITRLFT